MNVINRLTLRHMRLNRRRTLVSIMGIVLAVALMTMIPTVFYSLMDFAGREEMKTSGYYHVKIDNYLYDDNENVIDALDAEDYVITKNIGDYRCTQDEEGNVQLSHYTPSQDEKDVMRLVAVPDDYYKMRAYKLMEGRYPENDREIVIDVSDMHYWNPEPGDKLTIEGIQYTVSGTVINEKLEIGQGEEIMVTSDPAVQTLLNVSAVYTKLPDEVLNGETLVSGYFYVDNPGVKVGEKADELIEELEKNKINEPTDWYYDGPKASYNYDVLENYGMSENDSENAIYNSMLVIVETVIACVAASVVSNGFIISLSERSQYLGMLSSVGATKKQKRSSVYFEGFITAIIAIPSGIAIGIVTIIPFFNLIEEPVMRLAETKEPLRIVLRPETILWAVGFSMVTMIVALHGPAKRASRLTPVEAIRMNKDIKIPDKAVKPKRITRKLLGFEGELALKNLNRDNKKYISTAVSMAVSLILFMTIYSVIYYTTLEMENEANEDTEFYDYDMQLSYSEKTDDPLAGSFEEISDKVIATGALEEYYRYSELGIGEFDGEFFPEQKILNTDDKYYSDDLLACIGEMHDEYEEHIYPSLLVMGEEDLKKYLQSVGLDYEEFVSDKDNVILFDEFTESSWIYDNEQNYTGHVYNESLENIEYRIVKNKLERYEDERGETQTERVEIEHADIKFNVYSSEKKILGMQESYYYIYILLTPQKAKEVIETGYNMYEYCGYYKKFVFNTAKHREISGLINDELQKREELSMMYFYEDNTKGAEDEKDMLYITSVCIYGFILIVALICVVNIINTLSTSMALRRREFAMLKAVGMSEKTFRKMIIYESMFYGTKALFYGLPISTVFVLLTRYPYKETMEKNIGLPWSGYAISIAGVFIVIGITMLYSTSKIRKENVVELLKNENI